MVENCRAILQSVPEEEQHHDYNNVPLSGDSNNIPLSSEEQQSIYYMKVPNIKNEGDQVEELPIGAIPVNPNNLKRVNKVLQSGKRYLIRLL